MFENKRTNVRNHAGAAIKWKLSDVRAVCKGVTTEERVIQYASISMHSYFVFLTFRRCNFFLDSSVENCLEILLIKYLPLFGDVFSFF